MRMGGLRARELLKSTGPFLVSIRVHTGPIVQKCHKWPNITSHAKGYDRPLAFLSFRVYSPPWVDRISSSQISF